MIKLYNLLDFGLCNFTAKGLSCQPQPVISHCLCMIWTCDSSSASLRRKGVKIWHRCKTFKRSFELVGFQTLWKPRKCSGIARANEKEVEFCFLSWIDEKSIPLENACYGKVIWFQPDIDHSTLSLTKGIKKSEMSLTVKEIFAGSIKNLMLPLLLWLPFKLLLLLSSSSVLSLASPKECEIKNQRKEAHSGG